jgi:hypothetical protein
MKILQGIKMMIDAIWIPAFAGMTMRRESGQVPKGGWRA